jgi:hypothetical protein
MSRAYRPETPYQITSLIAVVLLLLIVFVSVGFFFFLARPDQFAAQNDLSRAFDEARALWQARRPAAYRYVLDRQCNCPPEIDRAYVVTVDREGQRATFPIPVESTAGILLDSPTSPVWLESIIADIGRALDGGENIVVRYNYLYGFPEFVDLAPGVERPDTVSRFEIRDFEELRDYEDSPD